MKLEMKIENSSKGKWVKRRKSKEAKLSFGLGEDFLYGDEKQIETNERKWISKDFMWK